MKCMLFVEEDEEIGQHKACHAQLSLGGLGHRDSRVVANMSSSVDNHINVGVKNYITHVGRHVFQFVDMLLSCKERHPTLSGLTSPSEEWLLFLQECWVQLQRWQHQQFLKGYQGP